MKKIVLLLVFLAGLLSAGACSEDIVTQLSLVSVSTDTFTHEGGVGSAEFNLKDITAVTSQPDWLKVKVFESTVLFNVYSNMSSEPRTGVLTVSARSAGSVDLTITQTPFNGLYVSAESLSFSDQTKCQSVAVISSGEYTVRMTENPASVFDFECGENGLVTFKVTRGQGRDEYSGRAVISLKDGGNPVTISLYMPEKSVYDYLVGVWEVTSNTADGNNRFPMTFKMKESQDSYYVYVDAPGIKAFPFVAEFINGNVKVNAGQEMGNDGTTFYNFHFNGPKNGEGNYILWKPLGVVAMEATPIFDEKSGKITLKFVDNGQGKEFQARDWAFFCGSEYWDFASRIAFYRNLELQKDYIE